MSKLVFAFALFLAGCAYHTHYVSPDRAVYPPLEPSAVSISPQKRIATPHKDVGRVAVTGWSNGEEALDRLRAEAARIGGNLVIDLKVEKTSMGVSASGLAVLLYTP